MMETRKDAAHFWFGLSAVVVLCTVVCLWFGLHGFMAVRVDPAVLTEPSGKVLECVRSGDYEALGEMLYGSPRLSSAPFDGGNAQGLIWAAYLDSIRYEFPGTFALADDVMELDVHIDCLDVSAVLDAVLDSAPNLSKENPQRYPNQETLISDALRDAAVGILAENPQMTSREMKLQLIRADDGWQVVPTPELQQLLSGFVSE